MDNKCVVHNHLHNKSHTISNRRLGNGALKSPSHSGVNTLLLSPRRSADTLEALVLVALEGLSPLLHDLGLVY